MASRLPTRVAGRRLRPGSSETTVASRWAIRAAVIGAIATLLASIGGLYFSAQTARQSTAQSRQAEAAQTSERFSRSVEQLGSDAIAVRIGAVYAFANLMRDAPSDQQAIVEILSSFIRVQAAQVPPPPTGRTLRSPPPDLLAAFRVLDDQPTPRSRHNADGTTTTWPSMLLSRVDLHSFDLDFVAMRGADLSFANMTDTRLVSTKLNNANLAFAYLDRAHIDGADLTGAYFPGMSLRGADTSMLVITSPGELDKFWCSDQTKVTGHLREFCEFS
jgi:hypothetical protein